MPQIAGTITRKSNGSLEFTPADGGAFNGLPNMGDEVTLDVSVTRTAAEIERAHAKAKAERAAAVDAAGEAVPVAAAPVGERRGKK